MFGIQNRRFLGNKYKLIDFIKTIMDENCPNAKSFFDVFAGTGVVAHSFMDSMTVITNDILYSNYVAHIAFLSNKKINVSKINNIVNHFNEVSPDTLADNYMSDTFGDTYFSYADCKKIGYAREYIEKLYSQKKINIRERAILITIVIYAMDRIANTCGHYDAYRKNVDFEKEIHFDMLDLSRKPIGKNIFYNDDSNKIIKEAKFPYVDCVYCDPPYNSRNYCDLYHVLENVARWEKPPVEGVAKKMDRNALKSKYCSRSAAEAFEDLVNNLNCKCIILSYNNTAKKANDRSNARISDDDIMRILSSKGEVKVYSQSYKAFTTGKSNNDDNEERLFVCNVFDNGCDNGEYAKSPLNYTGGKYKLLPQLLPLFPKDINTFVDIFAGAGNVGANTVAKKTVFNDNNSQVISLLKLFSETDNEFLVLKIKDIIKKYSLSESDIYGYEKYNCDSAKGLGSYNKAGFLRLRNDFNGMSSDDPDYYYYFFVLIIYAFNNQIRFNKNGCYNLPVGKRDFNKQICKHLAAFMHKLKQKDAFYISCDFRDFNLTELQEEDFIYCDPPYFLGTASYNEQGGWTEQDEKDLLDFLDNANALKIKFALSNVLRHKGKVHDLLINWSKKYNVHYLNYDYSNSNYHATNKKELSEEVLITNY